MDEFGFETKIIGHLDLDAFFASVEERDRPYLKGLPLAIGADPDGGFGRGIISTANYIAREYGIHSALPVRKAWEYSERARKQGKPAVVFLTPKGRKYSEVSKEVFDILKRHTKNVLIASVDEAYFDLSSTGSFAEAKKVVERIKKEILKETKLSCSIGVGPNKMIAKIASDFKKPDGLTVVTEEQVLDFLAPLSVRAIPGVGPKMGASLKSMGIETIAQARGFGWDDFDRRFGKHGFSLYQKLYGAGSINLDPPEERKSIGKHVTFYKDTLDLPYVTKTLEGEAENIFSTLLGKGFRGFRTIVVTIRFDDFETKNRSLTSSEAVTSLKTLQIRALKLALPFFDSSENPQKKPIRLVGLRIEKLE